MKKSKKEGFVIKYYWDGTIHKNGKPNISIKLEKDGVPVNNGKFEVSDATH